MLSQADFWAVKSSSDLIVGTFGLLKYIEHKQYSPQFYAQQKNHPQTGTEDSEINDLGDIELDTPLINRQPQSPTSSSQPPAAAAKQQHAPV